MRGGLGGSNVVYFDVCWYLSRLSNGLSPAICKFLAVTARLATIDAAIGLRITWKGIVKLGRQAFLWVTDCRGTGTCSGEKANQQACISGHAA